MAEIVEAEKAQQGKKKKPKKMSTAVDMTPMVDLFCLLITFFMLTTAFNKPKIMQINLPEKIKKDENVAPPKIAKSRSLNIILGPDDKVLWYPGMVEDPNNPPPLQVTDFSASGIREVLLDRNRALFRKVKQFEDDVISGEIVIDRDSLEQAINQLKKDDDTGPIVLIKAYKTSKYRNFVDIIDEMSIIGVARYTFVDISWLEEDMVENTLNLEVAETSTP
jgi:biopolymer transport protein ExbD